MKHTRCRRLKRQGGISRQAELLSEVILEDVHGIGKLQHEGSMDLLDSRFEVVLLRHRLIPIRQGALPARLNPKATIAQGRPDDSTGRTVESARPAIFACCEN